MNVCVSVSMCLSGQWHIAFHGGPFCCVLLFILTVPTVIRNPYALNFCKELGRLILYLAPLLQPGSIPSAQQILAHCSGIGCAVCV